jgi:hypothetical protein
MKQKHNGYLDGTLTMTHEVLMAFAKAHFDYLKLSGQWRAKSPDDEKIVAMAAEINALKSQLKLDPKLSAIAKDKKKDDKGENKGKKNYRKAISTRNGRKRMRRGRKCLPRVAIRRRSKWASILSIGVNTIRRGRSTSLRIAHSTRSTRITRETRERRTTTKRTCHRRIIGHCPFGHHHPQQSLRGSLGHVCGHERRRVMVRTSVHMGHIFSMRGWATRHGTRHLKLPFFLIHQLPTNLHRDPISSRLPY